MEEFMWEHMAVEYFMVIRGKTKTFKVLKTLGLTSFTIHHSQLTRLTNPTLFKNIRLPLILKYSSNFTRLFNSLNDAHAIKLF